VNEAVLRFKLLRFKLLRFKLLRFKLLRFKLLRFKLLRFQKKTKEGDILIIQSNDDNNPDHQHVINLNGLEMKWSGPYYVSFNNAKLQ
jgi:hypothetical protein